jgi:hypothetical protein
MSANDSTMSVEFRTIERFPGYRFGSDGSVWSRWRRYGTPGRRGTVARADGPWTLRSVVVMKSGYCYVGMKGPSRLDSRSRQTLIRVHRLILEAFVGPAPDGLECRHLDGDKSNNQISNLCWGTKLENRADRIKHGTMPLLLDEADVAAIRSAVGGGESVASVARRIGKPYRAVHDAAARRTWRHIA